MQSVKQETPVRRDPAPSRWGYRYQRLMLTPLFRTLLRKVLPVAVIAGAVGLYFTSADNREMVAQKVADIKASIQERPEFMVQLMAIDGVEGALAEEIRVVIPVDFPVSSFDLDLESMRETVEALSGVENAAVRVRPGGILQVDVVAREAVAIWRARDGLRLMDAGGAFVGPLALRSDRVDLPLIAGDGAKDHITEALALFEAAGPIAPRVRGLVRMGERRWDLVLDREQRILLPTENPVRALERVIALTTAQDLLERDLAVVDLRNPARPTIRLNPAAAEQLRAIKQSEFGGGN